jgi:rubrerythrin
MMKEDRTAFEKEFSIDLADRNLDVSKGIEISLKVEIEGRQFYAHNAKAIQNIDIKRFIEFLAGEEDKHIAILREVKESLKTRGAWVDFHEDRKTLSKVLEDLRVFKGKAGSEIRSAEDVTVLLYALKTEKDLVEFYEKFAHNIKDSKGKAFFLKLADWERTHYQLIEGIYDSITFFRMQS